MTKDQEVELENRILHLAALGVVFNIADDYDSCNRKPLTSHAEQFDDCSRGKKRVSVTLVKGEEGEKWNTAIDQAHILLNKVIEYDNWRATNPDFYQRLQYKLSKY
jgi:hypothetical protein